MSVIYHIYICVIYVCLSIGLSTYLSFYHSVCRSVYACLSINLSSVYLALSCFLVYLSVSLSCFLVCLSTLVPSLSVYLVFLSRLLCLPASLSVCQSVCLSWFLVCLFVFLRESIFFPCLSMHICLVYLSVCLAVCICLFLYSSISQSVFLSRTLEYRICSEPPPSDTSSLLAPSPDCLHSTTQTSSFSSFAFVHVKVTDNILYYQSVCVKVTDNILYYQSVCAT